MKGQFLTLIYWDIQIYQIFEKKPGSANAQEATIIAEKTAIFSEVTCMI